MEKVKLLSMTAVLTALIWASADSLVNEAAFLRVSVTVEPLANPNALIEVDPRAESPMIEVQVSGPRKIIEDVQRGPVQIRLRVPDQPTGSAALMLDREMLKRALTEESSEFGKLTIGSFQPTTVPLIVDHWITRQLNITMQRLTLAYDEQPQATPTRTTITVRESRFNQLARPEQRSRIDISAEVERQAREKPAGQRVPVRIVLDSSPYGPGARFDPAEIDVTVALKADRTSAEVPTVPIKLVVSFANLAKPYQAVARDGTPLTLVTQTIKVAGATEDVAKLLRGDTRAYGFIQLKEADLEQPDVFRAWIPSFHLPPNIELAEPPRAVEFKLTLATSTEYGT